MDKIAIYPFPYSSKNNKYVSLLYSALERVGGFEIINCENSLIKLFKLSGNSKKFSKNIVHIHWVNSLYGSKYLVKSIILGIVNFSILWFLKNIGGYKIFWTKHNYYSHDFPHPVIDQLGMRAMFMLADRIIVQQRMEHEKLQKNKKFIYIPHGNYINAYGLPGDRNKIRSKFGIKGDEILIISFGIVKPYKKIENIIKAFRNSANSKLKLLIAGQCSNKNYASRLKEISQNSSNILFLFDFIEDNEVADLLAGADFSVHWYDDSVLTSGGIILALSYGVPVIARDIPAGELIKEGTNGFLYGTESELASIFNKLEGGIFRKEEIINTVKDLSWDFVAKRLAEEVYKLE